MILCLTGLVMVLGFVLFTNVNAASQSVYIKQGNGPQASLLIYDATSGARYRGSNYFTSGHKLYVSLQERGTNGVFIVMSQRLLAPDSSTGWINYNNSYTGTFRVELNPELWYTDCDGYGAVESL